MKVFYRSEQVGPPQQYSPSAHKPKLVVEDWINKFGSNIEIRSFDPISEHDICQAHDIEFAKGILSGRIKNGFENTDMAVAKSLLYTSGSMYAAANYAVANKEVTCSPTSGFHHAEYRRAMGFCTLNGLMVTAIRLKNEGKVSKVGILDCDAHYGNGTDSIIGTLQIDWIKHHTQGRYFSTYSDAKNGAYEKWLDLAIEDCQDCDLILYQAGADPHIDDPYGGILSSTQMSERDEKVFTRLGHIPMAWNLAGGYQIRPAPTLAEQIEPVLELHRETVRQYLGSKK